MNLRLTQRLGLVLGACAVAALATATAGAGIRDGRSPDTRDAASAASSASPSAGFVERNDAAHFGGGGSTESVQLVRDGRSPDTLDAATQASATAQTPDWFERYANAHPYGGSVLDRTAPAASDGRSPDTRDAAVAAGSRPPVVVVASGGFDWTDAGIGAAGGFALALLVAGAVLLVVHRAARPKLAS